MAGTLSRRTFLALSALVGWGFKPSVEQAAAWFTPKLGVITDGLTEDFAKALDFISGHSMAYCEVRELWQKNVVNLSPAELRRARHLLAAHHLQVAEIGSPIFKYQLPEMPSAHPNENDVFKAVGLTDKDTESLLERVFTAARLLGTSKVRVFSYWRAEDPEKAYPYVRQRLAKAARLAGGNKITLLLENEHECNVGTGQELARLLRDINSPHLHGMWDPCNAVRLGEIPYPDGYRHVRGLFLHMHVKDIRRDPATGEFQYVAVGNGVIDYAGQLTALRDDHYDGTLSLEMAYTRPDGNKFESTLECLEGFRRILKAVNSKG